jgi:hypothetical protein
VLERGRAGLRDRRLRDQPEARPRREERGRGAVGARREADAAREPVLQFSATSDEHYHPERGYREQTGRPARDLRGGAAARRPVRIGQLDRRWAESRVTTPQILASYKSPSIIVSLLYYFCILFLYGNSIFSV